MTCQERRNREVELRDRVAAAAADYRSAFDEYRRLMAISSDVSGSDSILALQQAGQLLAEAVSGFSAALSAFSEFTRNNPEIAFLILDEPSTEGEEERGRAELTIPGAEILNPVRRRRHHPS